MTFDLRKAPVESSRTQVLTFYPEVGDAEIAKHSLVKGVTIGGMIPFILSRFMINAPVLMVGI